MKTCYECDSHDAELHHIVFRSQSKLMKSMQVNFLYLCSEHHRGNLGPHRNKKVDLRYKKMVQAKLFNLLHKEFYTSEGLSKTLKISKKQSKPTNKNAKTTQRRIREQRGYTQTYGRQIVLSGVRE